MRPFFAFLFTCILLTSCSIKPVSAPTFEGIHVNSASTKEIDVSLSLKIDNPNNFAITVKKIDLNVTVGGINLGKVKFDEKVKIPSKSISTQQFRFKTELSKLGLAAIPAALALATKKSLEVEAVGTIRARALLISRNFPVNFKDKVALK